MMSIKQWMISLTLLLATLSVSVSASWKEASSEVEQGIEQMFKEAALYRDKAGADLEPLYDSLDKITNNKVDYPYIAKVVMGKYYRQATDKQREEFQGVFKHTLLKTYGKTLVSFNIDKYQLVEPRSKSPEPDKQKVVINVSSKDGRTYSLDSYVVKDDGHWKLVNVVLDGFNLRITFKNQFAKIVQDNRGDVGSAIAQWAEIMSKEDS